MTSFPYNETDPTHPPLDDLVGEIRPAHIRTLLRSDRTTYAWTRRVHFSCGARTLSAGELLWDLTVRVPPVASAFTRAIRIVGRAGAGEVVVTLGADDVTIDSSVDFDETIDIPAAGGDMRLAVEGGSGGGSWDRIMILEERASPPASPTPIPQSVIEQYWPDEGVGYDGAYEVLEVPIEDSDFPDEGVGYEYEEE